MADCAAGQLPITFTIYGQYRTHATIPDATIELGNVFREYWPEDTLNSVEYVSTSGTTIAWRLQGIDEFGDPFDIYPNGAIVCTVSENPPTPTVPFNWSDQAHLLQALLIVMAVMIFTMGYRAGDKT